ncbi:MAG TPA: SpaA isopeptide-forming pilin-related protein, partial [Pirellulales bacterium]|nr:SpaA isopeptide-forming pilin-related protein [Pirellulales bacterium]
GSGGTATATSSGYTPTGVGTEYWVATFNGDTSNAKVTSGATAEQVNVDTITTSQQPATATVGSSVADTATVTGLVSPSSNDTVTFNLYSSATVQNSGTLLFTDTETVSLNGGTATATSKGYTATATGTDYWVATFNGDTNNAIVTSGPTAEPVKVTPASPMINTKPGGTVSLGNITINGTKYLDLTGNGFSSDDKPYAGVTINLYQGGTGPGTSGDTLVATTTTANDGSFSFGLTSAGTYYVQESVPTGYVQTGGGPNGAAGNTYYTVVASAGHSYSGYNFDDFMIPTCTPTNVSYTITTPSNCTTTVTTLAGNTAPGDTVTVTFTVPAGMNDTLTLVSYYAQGSFSDANANQQLIYQQATGTFAPGTHSLTVKIPNTYYQIDFVCGQAIDQLEPNQNNDAYGPDAAEILYHAEQRYIDSDSGGSTAGTPNTKTPSVPAPTSSGTSSMPLTDSATLSGGYNPGGTITFYLFAPGVTPNGTDSNNVYSDVVTVNGNGTYTTSQGNHPGGYVATVAGIYQWVAVYSGDGNNNGVTSPFGSEPETVGQSTPAIVTNAGGAVVVGSGNKLADSATLSGANSPGGSITFYLFAPGVTPNGTDSNNVYSEKVTVNGNGTYNTGTGTATGSAVPTMAGTYEWLAVYSGDANNTSVDTDFGDEPETVTPASPTIKTTPGGTVAIGNITVSGTKYLDLTGNGFSADDTPLGGVTINLYQGGTGPGTTGDKLVATTTTANDGSYSFGLASAGTYFVQESVSAGYVQTGGGPNGTAGNTYYTVVASANHSYSGYNFDDFMIPTCTPTNVSYTITTPSNCTTTVTTLAGNTAPGDTVTVTFTVPAGMNDTLTLVSYYAQGSFSDSNAHQQLIYQQATGTFAPGTHSLTVKIPNTYYQIDFVCGQAIDQLEPNQNNNAYGPDSAEILYHPEGRYISSDSGGSTAGTLNTETPSVPAPTSSTTSTLPLTDSATLSGGYSPGGTITFYLFAPGVTPNGTNSNNVYSDTVTVNGNGTYTTASGNHPGGYSATAPGTYEWVAVYSGDGNNNGVVSKFGDEPETVGSGITISGTKYNDLTGNGFSADDTGLGGVTINLYLETNGSAGLQTGSGGDQLVATTTTASDGTFTFSNNLAPGTYYVQESVPTGYIQTGGGPNGSAGSTYYTVVATSGNSYSGESFDDFQVPTCTPTCVSYVINNNNCKTTVSDLHGATQQGDTVTVTFTVPAGMNDQLSLVSYIAPASSFNSATAYQQQIFDVATGIFTPGTHSLTVLIPNCYYQIDFVCGQAINVLGNPSAGPDASDIFYTPQGRLLSSDGGGTQAFSTKPVAGGDFGASVLWTTSNGQNLLNKLNGSSSATSLALWLATTFPNLYGAGAGSHSLVNSGGSYFTDSQVVSAYSKFAGGDQQVLSAALSVYTTSVDLAGSASATSYAKSPVGLNTSLAGSGMDTYNVGVNGAAFGVANNTVATVMQLLVDVNANTSPGASVSSGANAVFSGINTIGNVKNATLSSSGLAYTADQVRTAYGVNNLALDGTGQTIAIVDAYDNPSIFQSLDSFDQQMSLTTGAQSLYTQYGSASSFLTVIGQDGTTTNLPSTDPTGAWETEIALDVEWIHAMAPGAQIVLVEANSQSLSDLMASVGTAASQPGVSVVSMSWGFAEGQSVLAADEAMYDGYLTTPAGHQGVTFVASTGDYGAADPEYPAFSPNVVAVGGTSLYLNGDNSYKSETGWGYFSNSLG